MFDWDSLEKLSEEEKMEKFQMCIRDRAYEMVKAAQYQKGV